MSLFYFLRRHPLPIHAYFRHSLVLTYALPKETLRPLLPTGLMVDTYEDWGFVAIAMVQTENLRPAFLPRVFGKNFFLSGYRIFSRFTTSDGRKLRGLRILRSDTDSHVMAISGNLLTHYNYRKASVSIKEEAGRLSLEILTPNSVADLKVVANIGDRPSSLPDGSPFKSLKEARHFAGPLPWTFDYERETQSVIMIRGIRENWDPMPVQVDVQDITFFAQEPFRHESPVLANAFYVHHIPYRWEPGLREHLPRTPK